MTYTLWATETRTVVAWFDAEGAALAAVREMSREDGRAAAETLFLGHEGAAGTPRLIAAGAALIERAEAASAASCGA